jgi:hypothetical protein
MNITDLRRTLSSFIILVFVCSYVFAECEVYENGRCIDDVEIVELDGFATDPNVSPTNKARLIYNDTDNKLKVSKNGGAYTEVGAGGGGSVYVNTAEITDPDFTNSTSLTWGASGSTITATVNESDTLQSVVTRGATTTGGVTLATSSGNVGIGTTEPTAKLDVSGTTTITGDTRITAIPTDMFSAVWYWTTAWNTNNTTEASSSRGTTFSGFASSSGTSRATYVGSVTPFTSVLIYGSTYAIGATMKAEYWNGSTWTDYTASCTDGTTNYTVRGAITFTAPADWAMSASGDGGVPAGGYDATSRYWFRFSSSIAPSNTMSVFCVLPRTNTNLWDVYGAPGNASGSELAILPTGILSIDNVAASDGVTNFLSTTNFSVTAYLSDNVKHQFGSSNDSGFMFSTTGNDNLQLGLVCNDATNDTGYISIIEFADFADVDRSPLAATVDPTLRIYSSDATNATDYIEFFHNQTIATIQAGDGMMNLVGNIGIGTTSPAQKLDVNGTAAMQTITRASGDLSLTTTTSGDIIVNSIGVTKIGANVDFTDAGAGTALDSYVKTLLQFNGVDASTTMTNAVSGGTAWTANGNAQLATAVKKWGTASLKLDGTDDYLEAADSADFTMGAGNFTIEAQIKLTSASTIDRMWGQVDNAATNASASTYAYVNAGKITAIYFDSAGTPYSLTMAGTLDTNWHHIAYVRNGTTITLYVDGTADGTVGVSTSSMKDSTQVWAIGRNGAYNDANEFDGYIDEFKIDKGVARYTANFTAPVAEYVTSAGYQDNTGAYFTTSTDTDAIRTVTTTGSSAVVAISSKIASFESMALKNYFNMQTLFAGNVGIGTTAQTAPTQALQVTGNIIVSGNVGVGATSPTQKLDVNGNVNIGSGAAGVDYAISVNGETTDQSITFDEDNDLINISDEIRADTTLYRRYYHANMISANPGASGATWKAADANQLCGWDIDAASEVLVFSDLDVHADWDGASDLNGEFKFSTNVDNTGGGAGDTVDIKCVLYYKKAGDVATRTQTVEGAIVVGAAAQYKQFTGLFPINWDEASNVVAVGDVLCASCNIETDTSEVDDITVHSGTFYYNTKHIGIEAGDV